MWLSCIYTCRTPFSQQHAIMFHFYSLSLCTWEQIQNCQPVNCAQRESLESKSRGLGLVCASASKVQASSKAVANLNGCDSADLGLKRATSKQILWTNFCRSEVIYCSRNVIRISSQWNQPTLWNLLNPASFSPACTSNAWCSTYSQPNQIGELCKAVRDLGQRLGWWLHPIS